MMVEDSENADLFGDAARAMFEKLSPERKLRVERRAAHNKRYLVTQRDKVIGDALDLLCENVATGLFGKAGKRRALFMIGESDSGKTMALEHHIAKREEFKPYTNKFGDIVRPFVSFEPPRPITLKGFARAAIGACGFPVNNRNLTEQELFDMLKDVIRNTGTLFLHIDEMQHVLKGKTTDDVQNVADIIKSLLQMPGWPLHMILTGVPSLARFLLPAEADSQLRNRSYVIELPPLSEADSEAMLHLQDIIMEGAHLSMDGVATPEFIQRIFHACSYAFGTTIQIMQAAAELAVGDGSNVVTADHYARVYALNSGCRPRLNIFKQPEWRSIQPRSSLAITMDGPDREGMTPRKIKAKDV